MSKRFFSLNFADLETFKRMGTKKICIIDQLEMESNSKITYTKKI